MIEVAIYARVSKKHEQETENQLLQLREYCNKSGWTIAREYVDRESGAKASRAGFVKMMTEASQKQFNVVLFWALDRFTREGVRKTLLYLDQLESYGVNFKSFTEPYLDTTGIFRDVVISLLATMAKQERIRISERVLTGLERAKLAGKVGGRPRRGESKKDAAKGLSYEQLLAKIVALKKEALSNRAIAKKLKISHHTVAKYYSEYLSGLQENK